MTITRRKAAVAASILAVAAGAWSARAWQRVDQVRVMSAPVSRGPIVRTIIATGTLEPVETVHVGAQISGTIDALHADFNSVVRKGQVLATLEPDQLDAELGQAQAALAQAQAALEQAEAAQAGNQTAALDAKIKLDREEALAARSLVPQSDLDAARNAMNAAAADVEAGRSFVGVASSGVEQARAQLRQAQVNRDHAVITSPIDGIVVARNVDVGQTVAATIAAPILFDVASDFARMQLEVDVDETDIDGIEPGAAVTFEVESYPDQFVGTVAQVRLQPVAEQTTTATTAGAPAATVTTTTVASVVGYATMIDVANPDGRLRPGMTATVTMHGTHVDDVLRIPNAALSFRPSDRELLATKQTAGPAAAQSSVSDAGDAPIRRVWRFDGARFTPVDVRTGITDGQWTEALGHGALRDGDLLVTNASLGP